MADRFDQHLQRVAADYRSIRAPAGLAGRIVAQLPRQQRRRNSVPLWLGLAAAGVAAVVLFAPGTGPSRKPAGALTVLSLPTVPPTPRLNLSIRSPGLGSARLPVIPPTPRPESSRPAGSESAEADA